MSSPRNNPNASFEDGQLGFVLIPKNDAMLSQQVTQRMYWPALLFSSQNAMRHALPFFDSRQSFKMEWEFHEMFFISAWKRAGLISPDDGEVKAALLLGSEVPPCATRSVPIGPRDVPAIRGGTPLKPYVVLGSKKMTGMREMPGYATNVQFQEAMDLAEQYMKNKDTKSVCTSSKWPVFPNGVYHGDDPCGYTAEGWMCWNGEWHCVAALSSEAELEQTYPTYKFYPRPPYQESYAQKCSRIHQIQLSTCRMQQAAKKAMQQAAKKAKPTKVPGVSDSTIRRREKSATEALEKTGEMHLFDVVMAKIWAQYKGSKWKDSILATLIDEARAEWKNHNGGSNSVRAEDSVQGSVASALSSTSVSFASMSVSAESPSDLDGTDTISASASADSSHTAAPARITPDKPQNDTTSNNSDNSATSSSDNENVQPKRKKQKRGRREVTDLVIPGSLPREGMEWEKPVREMPLSRAYGLESLPQQPAFAVISNDGDQPFYAQGTGIKAVEMHFLPKNVRFPNDAVMNQAAINARTVVARVFGGDELIGQRDRKYSAYKFNTVSLVDMTVSPTTSAPLNRCMSVLYFSQVENTRSLWIEWFASAVEYRGKKIGLSTFLLQNILDLAILDDGIDHVYLEVGRDKEGQAKWKAARHVYEKAGFNIVENDDSTSVPDEIVESCKHFDDINYDIMRFDCDGKRVPRKSTRRGRTRSSSAS